MACIVYYDIVKHEMNWFYLTLSVMFIFRADPKFLRLTPVTLKIPSTADFFEPNWDYSDKIESLSVVVLINIDPDHRPTIVS